jgi:4-aminobutyrate aminotransferase
MKRLRIFCDRYGILLVVDEVQCGLGRTGRWWACEHAGVLPDIVAIGKAIASGFPLAAVAASLRLMQQWLPGAHGTTFGGNPVSCAAALATLAVMKEERLVEYAARLGHQAIADLKALQQRFPCIGDVRGVGLMIGVEIVDKEGRPDRMIADRIRDACLARGLVVIECGLEKNILRIAPSLNLTFAEWAEGLHILSSAMEEISGK